MEDLLTDNFRAQLTFFEEKKGGRKTPTGDGYRAELHFTDFDYVGYGAFEFKDQEMVFPGDVLEGTIALVNADRYEGKLYAGSDFSIFEGDQKIGTGVILAVFTKEGE